MGETVSSEPGDGVRTMSSASSFVSWKELLWAVNKELPGGSANGGAGPDMPWPSPKTLVM